MIYKILAGILFFLVIETPCAFTQKQPEIITYMLAVLDAEFPSKLTTLRKQLLKLSSRNDTSMDIEIDASEVQYHDRKRLIKLFNITPIIDSKKTALTDTEKSFRYYTFTQQGFYRCATCMTAVYKELREVLLHQRYIHHQLDIIVCPTCSDIFSDISFFRGHQVFCTPLIKKKRRARRGELPTIHEQKRFVPIDESSIDETLRSDSVLPDDLYLKKPPAPIIFATLKKFLESLSTEGRLFFKQQIIQLLKKNKNICESDHLFSYLGVAQKVTLQELQTWANRITKKGNIRSIAKRWSSYSIKLAADNYACAKCKTPGFDSKDKVLIHQRDIHNAPIITCMGCHTRGITNVYSAASGFCTHRKVSLLCSNAKRYTGRLPK